MIVKAIAPVYGGVNLEDISAPRCFEIEARLRDELDIPVFHDDQHGTAIVVLAALTNALRVVDKKLEDVRIVVSGVGAAGHAIIRLLRRPGRDRHRRLRPARRRWTRRASTPDEFRDWIAENTNPAGFTGTLKEVLAGADVFIGVSAPEPARRRRHRHDGRPTRSCFALANPDPEVDPIEAQPARRRRGDRAQSTTRTRSTTCWPSRGSSAACSTPALSDITDEMMIAAATAIADCVRPERAQRELHRPERLRPRRGPGRRRGRARRARRAPYGASVAASRTADAPPPTASTPCRRPDAPLPPTRPGSPTPTPPWRPAFPGDRAIRQPVHTVYVPADRFDADLVPALGRARRSRSSTSTAARRGARRGARVCRPPLAAEVLRPGAGQARSRADRGPAHRLRGRLRQPRRTPRRTQTVDAAAAALAASRSRPGTAPPFIGIRFKSFEAPTPRARRAHPGPVRRRRRGSGGPAARVRRDAAQGDLGRAGRGDGRGVRAARGRVSGSRSAHCGFEIQVETPQSILGPDGTALVARMVHASRRPVHRRCTTAPTTTRASLRHRRGVPDHGAPGRRPRQGGHAGRRRRHRRAALRRLDERPPGRRPRPRCAPAGRCTRAWSAAPSSAATTRAGTCTRPSCRPGMPPRTPSTARASPAARRAGCATTCDGRPTSGVHGRAGHRPGAGRLRGARARLRRRRRRPRCSQRDRDRRRGLGSDGPRECAAT